MKQRPSQPSSIPPLLILINENEQLPDPLQVINLIQVQDQVLHPHVLLVVRHDTVRICIVLHCGQVHCNVSWVFPRLATRQNGATFGLFYVLAQD
jgi:hypothetical protein